MKQADIQKIIRTLTPAKNIVDAIADGSEHPGPLVIDPLQKAIASALKQLAAAKRTAAK